MKKLKRKLIIGTAAALAAAGFAAGCNRPVSVYGPPPDATSEISSSSETEPSSIEYSSEKNIPEPVYGPPPEDEFDPAENVPEDVYGPPSWFGEDDGD